MEPKPAWNAISRHVMESTSSTSTLIWNGDSWNGIETAGMEWRQLEWNGDSWNGMETAGMEWRQLEWNGDSWNGMETRQ